MQLRLSSLLFALAATVSLGASVQDDAANSVAPPADPIVLPPGELSELLARLWERDPSVPEPPQRWPDWSDRSESGWGGAQPWREWVELVRAEARGATNDRTAAVRRARLALLAVDQGRGGDAWRHLLAAGEDPIVLAILPALLPGVPLDRLGSDEPLPPGALLRPMVPPPALDIPGDVDPIAPLVGRVMEHRELRIGNSLIALRVLVESDGVQIDLTRRTGPTVDVRVLPPRPPGVRIGLLYSDWAKVGTERLEVPLGITDDSERHTIWARFLPDRNRWPAAPTASQRESAGDAFPEIHVVVSRGRSEDPLPARFAAALAELFGTETRLRFSDERALESPFEPIEIHLDGGGDLDPKRDPEERLIGIFALVEAQALAGAARR